MVWSTYVNCSDALRMVSLFYTGGVKAMRFDCFGKCLTFALLSRGDDAPTNTFIAIDNQGAQACHVHRNNLSFITVHSYTHSTQVNEITSGSHMNKCH